MASPLRAWWRNCALEPDLEILGIDRLEDAIAPLDPGFSRVRELISDLELCHHKAERWIENIVQAIADGDTHKGLGTRQSGRMHPAEEVWESACAALSAWCAGSPAAELAVGSLPASGLLGVLGERTPLKEWQVRRVVEKIRDSIHWPRHSTDYDWLLLAGGEYEAAYRVECPERYREHEDQWRATVETRIGDTIDGEEARLSLALAIDMLWPCHWRFLENLRLVLAAIGGNLEPEEPFAACGRNISLRPAGRLNVIAATLRTFCGAADSGQVDQELLVRLGEPTPERRWLAASLEKTMRLQVSAPAAVRRESALYGPDWLTS